MRTEQLLELMRNPHLHRTAHAEARRRSGSEEDQEEYVSDAWLRVSRDDPGKDIEYYAKEIARAIHAAYVKKRRASNVHTNVNGIGRRATTAKPRDALHLGGRRYLNRKPTRFSAWYYDGEWLEYGLTHDDLKSFSVHEIVVLDQ